MKVDVTSLVAILIAVSALPARSDDDTVSEGIKAFRAGNYAKAEQLYKQALSEETSNDKQAAIYRNLSLLYRAQGKDGSEFSRKADELDPPVASKRIDGKNGDSLILNARSAPPVVQRAGNGTEPTFQISNPLPQRQNGDISPSTSNTMQMSGSPGVFSGMSASSLSSVSSMNLGVGLGRGGFSINGGVSGGSRMGAPGFGSYGPMYYSSQTSNGNYVYSQGTPVILTTPNGRPFYINAPGPNIYQSQQSPDGSSTTIIKRTY